MSTNRNKQIASFGSWPSAIHSHLLTQASVRLSEPVMHQDDLFWLESRPLEKGRSVLMRCVDGKNVEVLPSKFSVGSRVHEYGGGSYCISDDSIYFVNSEDQNIYQHFYKGEAKPSQLSDNKNCRYADLTYDQSRQRIICVQEQHNKNREPSNSIIALNLKTKNISTLISGNDFYSNPCLSPNQQQLCWLSWDHPNMPWDNTECWIADVNFEGHIVHHSHIAGGLDGGAARSNRGESIFQPRWHANGDLYFVSDRNNWWNIYCYQPSLDRIISISNLEMEFATPQWVFGMSCYDFLSAESILACATQNGVWQLAHINLLTLKIDFIDINSSDIASITCNGKQKAALFSAAANRARSLDQLVFDSNTLSEQSTICLSSHHSIVESELSTPASFEFSTGKNPLQKDQADKAYGFFYPPTNDGFEDAADSKPPVVVLCHGGPTGAAETGLNLKIQYWTNRGFAVADINYRGSTGYGRDYRQKLHGQWGISDVEDVCAAVKHLAKHNLVDPDRAIIKGSSAGGFTVLAALTFSDTFKAGASLYGIGNLETLALDTHKFEARYMDSLVGAYPQDKQIYLDRSPLFHTEQLNCPVIFFQGSDDKVVPPNQAEAMVNALQAKGVPVAYVEFKGEGHGFRQADSIQRCLENELSFYAQIFGFTTDDTIAKVDIKTS